MLDPIHQTPPANTLRTRGVSADVRIDGEVHEMHDWSLAGVSFETPEMPLQAGEAVKLTLRFHLPDESVGVWIDGRVIRSDAVETAVAFDDLKAYAQRRMARVIDGLQAKTPQAMH